MEGAPGRDPLIGRRIGKYEIGARLGAGGGGVVYKALDTDLQRTVALKFLPRDRDADAPRFLREARAASALDHPNIGVIHGMEQAEDGQTFIVMTHYDGETLARRCARGPLPAAQAAQLIAQAAAGIAAAHGKGIVHRDLKPSNLLVTVSGAVKVLDFGVARLADGVTLTDSATTVGTVAYMSPEQAKGPHVDHRSDIWSLGVVLYELVTGRLPFDRGNIPATLLAITRDRPAPMDDAPPGIQAVISRCLQKDPGARYQSAEELRRDLEQLSAGTERPTGTLNRSTAFARRRRAGQRAMIVAGLAVLLGAGAWYGKARWTRPAALREKHIVVLPFSNVGGDPANRAVCDGLLETLTNRLSALEGLESSLWVAPASEVRRQNIVDAAGAQRAFGANLVVAGSVQRNSQGVRLALSLVDARTLRQLGSAMLDDRLGDYSALQDNAVGRLAKLLEVELSPGAHAGAGETAGPAAYESYLKGVSFLQRYDKPGNLEQAVRTFQEAVARDPGFALAHAKLGEAKWLQSQLTKEPGLAATALADCMRALQINDQLAPAHIILGRIHADTGKYDLAIEQFQRALSLNPRDADAHQRIAKAYEALGRPKDAESSLKKAVDLRPDYWDGQNSLGAFYMRQQRYREAAERFRKVTELTPDNSAAYSNLGAALNRIGDGAGARAAYETSIRIAPTYPAYNNLARSYYVEGHYSEAATLYEKALALNEKDYRPWAGMASSYYAIGEAGKGQEATARAAKILEAAVVNTPNDAAALSYLAFLSARLKNRTAAETRLRSAMALGPENRDVLYNAALTYEQLGERRLALDHLRAAVAGGYSRESIERDPDLKALREDPAYASIFK